MSTSATAVRTPVADCGREASPGAAAHERAGSGRRIARLALTSSMVVSFLAASAAPTPLYDRYESLWHSTPLIGTIAFAVYALAVLAGLLWLGELATHVGRRTILLAAVAGQVAALILFAVAGSFELILVGRAIQGLAAGSALGALSATMIESDPDRGAIASAASPTAGSGLGALVSGVVVQFLPAPTHTIYLLLIVVLALQALGVARLIDAMPRRRVPRSALRPRIAIPSAARTGFLATAPIMFAVWSLGGFYGALSPALYRSLSHDTSVWHSAVALFLLACVGSVTTIALRRVGGRTLTIIGALMLIAGLIGTVVAIQAGSVALYLAVSAIAGIGFGAGFQGPIRILVPLAQPAERAGMLSAVFIIAYVALGLPAVIAGALVSSGASLSAVAIVLAVVLAALTAGALVATLRKEH
jgi:predicted MFS family arabinose efflux permease